MSRREYDLSLFVNERMVVKIIIDDHYEEKHSESINDELILALVKKLDNGIFEPEDVRGDYEYYVTDEIYLGKMYRLIWLLEDKKLYIGIINAYRRS